MPPRRRRRDQGADPEPDSEQEATSLPPAFFSTTYTLHRCSPLHLSQPLDRAHLDLLSRRLRDVLVGDVVRGVQVGLSTESYLPNTGALEAVEWSLVSVPALLSGPERERAGSEELGSSPLMRRGARFQNDETLSDKRALYLELRYERATYEALLLPDISDSTPGAGSADLGKDWAWTSHPLIEPNQPQEDASSTNSMNLPLLLYRLPAPLRPILTSFLSSTFDCRVSTLALGTRTLVDAFESWLADGGRLGGKDVVISLGFYVPASEVEPGQKARPAEEEDDEEEEEQAPGGGSAKDETSLGLKGLDVYISAPDIRRFVRAGQNGSDDQSASKRAAQSEPVAEEERRRQRRRLAGNRAEEGWEWRLAQKEGDALAAGEEDDREQPFIEALGRYVQHHLALDLFHPGVRITRVACEGFVLSEGRMKILSSGDTASRNLLERLIDRAKGGS